MADVFSQMRGGDKALVPCKAEAKACHCAPFFKNVDDSARGAARCLTAFGQNRAAAGRRQDATRKGTRLTRDATHKGRHSQARDSQRMRSVKNFASGPEPYRSGTTPIPMRKASARSADSAVR